MNWYWLYRFALRNPYDMDSIVICKEMFETIKSLYKNGKIENQTVNYKINPEKFKNHEINEAILNLTIENENIPYSDFEVGGYFLEEHTIEIIFKISNEFSDRSFEKLYSRLFDVIRHEVQHFVDFVRGTNNTRRDQRGNQINIVDKIQDASNFILSDKELVPYIRGMMLRAKKQRISFKDVVKEMIDRNFYGSSIEYKNKLKAMSISKDISLVEDITFNRIMEKASEIYPKLKETI